MAFFRKKSDPISARARELNEKIAHLQAEIQKLSAEPAPAAAPTPVPAEPLPPSPSHPRLRSTAVPHGPTIVPQHSEVFLEAPEQKRLKEPKIVPEPRADLGMAKSDLGSSWRRFTNNFRGPATSNPKLVNYLAAGSIQGLRPLRYEKRVARNRFIVLSGILILLLWGIVAIVFRR